MEHKPRTTLDNNAFRGRLRTSRNAVLFDRPFARQTMDGVHRARPASKPQAPIAPVVLPQASESIPMSVRMRTQPLRSVSSPNKRPDLPKQLRSSVLKRQTVRGASKKFRPKKHKAPLMPMMLSGMALMLFLVGIYVGINSFRTNRQVKAQVSELSRQAAESDGSDEGVPDETPPTNVDGYTVAPDLPRFLNIQKLGTHARIKRLGVTADNALKTPTNVYDVGWYEGSAKPGENGTVVMDGHVSGPNNRGVFYGLKTLKTGDKVEVVRGDGKKFTYTVTGSQVYDNDKVDMARVMTTSVPGKSALNLITCTGRYSIKTQTFDQRVVVFTVQD